MITETGNIKNGIIHLLSRYNSKIELENTIEKVDNLCFLSIQGKFIKNNVYYSNITIYLLCEIGSEKYIIIEKDNVFKEIKRMNPDSLFGDLEIDGVLFGKQINFNHFLSSGIYLRPNGPCYFYYYKQK